MSKGGVAAGQAVGVKAVIANQMQIWRFKIYFAFSGNIFDFSQMVVGNSTYI